jgi:hypothetical protein
MRMKMDVDTSLELATGDAVLEIPWSSPDGALRYRDLVAYPELLKEIREASEFPELAEFLARVNAAERSLQTVKCDTWASDEIEPAEQIYGVSSKHGCYCDLVFREGPRRFSLDAYETVVTAAAAKLRALPDVYAAIEFVIRRCYFWEDGETRQGFAITTFVVGYGADAADAQKQCGTALLYVSGALESFDNSVTRPVR